MNNDGSVERQALREMARSLAFLNQLPRMAVALERLAVAVEALNEPYVDQETSDETPTPPLPPDA